MILPKGRCRRSWPSVGDHKLLARFLRWVSNDHEGVVEPLLTGQLDVLVWILAPQVIVGDIRVLAAVTALGEFCLRGVERYWIFPSELLNCGRN